MKPDDIKEACHAGAATAEEIADFLDLDPSTVRRYGKRYAEDDACDIIREEKPGGGYVYGVRDEDADAGAEMPVFGDREYSWVQMVPPPSDAVYLDTDGELADIEAILDDLDRTGQNPRFRLKGPPGTGKTTLARHVAAERSWPVIPIQFTAAMRDSELYGSPHIIGGESVWVDGPVVKALLCSQQREVVLILDEINRSPFHRKASLQSVLDGRAEATLQLRGGEVIKGDPQNLVSIATMNEGEEYETFPIDPAEKRRHSNTWDVDFLGLVEPDGADREAGLIAERTPVTPAFARVLVEAANEVREFAKDDPTSPIDKGIATSVLLEWARTAAAYRKADRPDPIARAARTSIVYPFYSGPAADEVEAVLLDTLRSTSERVEAGV